VGRIRFGTGAVPLLLRFIVLVLLLFIVLDPLLFLVGEGFIHEAIVVVRNVEAAFKRDKLTVEYFPFVGIPPNGGARRSFTLASLKGGDGGAEFGDTVKGGRHGGGG
jgi:hypothetical protein